MDGARLKVYDGERRCGDEDRAMPSGTPAWITAELIKATRRVWEPRYGRRLSCEEAITIVQNAGRLFDVLSRE